MNTEITPPELPIPRVGTLIAITISPRPSDPDPKKQLLSHVPILRKLKLCSKEFSLNAEITLNGVLHYHGTLLITNQIYWYRTVLPLIRERLGFVLIKPNPDHHWTNYCNKDIGNMIFILDLPLPINYDHPLLDKLKRNICQFKKKVPDIKQPPKEGKIIEQMYPSPD